MSRGKKRRENCFDLKICLLLGNLQLFALRVTHVNNWPINCLVNQNNNLPSRGHSGFLRVNACDKCDRRGGGVIVVTFYLCIYPSLDLPYNTFKMNWPIFLKLNKEHFTFHLRCKHSGTFANGKYEDLSYPENPKMCYAILVTLLKMQLLYSQTIRENATSSSGTSP